jgi:hypothetical protein
VQAGNRCYRPYHRDSARSAFRFSPGKCRIPPFVWTTHSGRVRFTGRRSRRPPASLRHSRHCRIFLLSRRKQRLRSLRNADRVKIFAGAIKSGIFFPSFSSEKKDHGEKSMPPRTRRDSFLRELRERYAGNVHLPGGNMPSPVTAGCMSIAVCVGGVPLIRLSA